MKNTSPASRFTLLIVLCSLFIWTISSGVSSAAFQQQPSTTPKVPHPNPQREELLPPLPDSTTSRPRPRADLLVQNLLTAPQYGASALKRKSQSSEKLDHPAEAAEFFRFKRLPAGEKELPIEKYFEAQERMLRMPQFSTADNRFAPSRAELKDSPEQQRLGEWTPLGPGNIGGRTRAILINPNDPNVMYAAGVAGGVWKSIDAGATWKPLTDLIANIAVNAMAFEPANPNVIYAGTGEGYFNGDGVRGAGIFKTTDGGATWTRLQNTATEDFHFVNDIVVSPNDNRRVYAATRTGVWRSTDSGATWARTHTPPGSFGGVVTGGCLDLAIRTDRTTDHVLASCGTFEQATVYRNADAAGDGNWAPVLTEAGMGRTALAIAPSNQNVIYALASSIDFNTPYYRALHAVFRSTDGGATWTAQTRNTNANKMNTSLLSFPIFTFATDCGYGLGDAFDGQAWYDITIAVDPVDADRVWAGGIDLFRSDDGGINWGQAGFVYVFQTFTPKIHPDQHVIVFHPRYNGATNQTMFAGNDGGLYRTDNARAAVVTDPKLACNPNNAAVKWTAINNDYGVTQFYHGLPRPDGRSYFGGTQDNGTLLGADSAGVNGWKMINGGDGGYVAVDSTSQNTLYSAYTGISIQKSTDNGATFSGATFGISDLGLFINPYVMDPSDPQRLWSGGYLSIWRSDDGAAHWTPASEFDESEFIARARTSALAVSPTDSNFVVAGTVDGFVLFNNDALTANRRSQWRSGFPRSGFVSWVAIGPGAIYATFSTFGGEHVWRSDNGGLRWTPIDGAGDGQLPDVPVHCLVVDPTNPSRLYIGTDLGVFVSNNGGESWAVENTGFANVVVESLAINVVNGTTTLYAFTHGRGAWRVTVNTDGCDYTLSPATRSFGV
ncbi:MAG: WD40/YVTN/BNR-like repeat-containing protein [Blastocatellia bacterium]